MSTVVLDSQKLKLLREQQALSQEGLEFACSQKKGCRVSIATIKRAELGSPLSQRTAVRLANFFSIPVHELIAVKPLNPISQAALGLKRKMCVVLWLNMDFQSALNHAETQLADLSPLFKQRIGNTLVIALPCLCNQKKTYLPLQQIILTLFPKFAVKCNHYSALISLETLEQSIDQSWYLDERQLATLSATAFNLETGTIAVCELLCEASCRSYHYTVHPHLPALKQLVHHIDHPDELVTLGRAYEMNQLKHTIDALKHEKRSAIVTICGHEGMGKSHLLNQIVRLGTIKTWQKIQLDFERLTTGLTELALLRQQLQTTSANSYPVLITLDNLHLVDSQTFILLINIISDTRNQPILWVLSCLPSKHAQPLLEELHYLGPNLVNLSLEPLTHAQLKRLTHSDSLGSEQMSQIYYQQSGGNPYYFQMLLRAQTQNTVFPPLLTYLVQCQYDTLKAEERLVLALLSLSMHELTSDDMFSLHATCREAIDVLQDLNLIRLSYQHRLSLTHPWIKEVVKTNLSEQDKHITYLFLAAFVEENNKAKEHLLIPLANYYRQANHPLQAAQAFLRCGKQLIQEGNYTDAKACLNCALENQQQTSHSSESDGLLLDIRLCLATITRITYGWVSHSTVSAYQQCLNLAKQQHCITRHCVALTGVWVTQLMAMEFELSEETALEILTMANKSGEQSCISLAHSCLANTQFWLAKHQDAIDNAEQAFKSFFNATEKSTYEMIGINPLVLAGCFGSLSASILCDHTKVQYFQRYNHNSAFINNDFCHAIILQGEMWVNFHQRHFDQVLLQSQQLISLSEGHHFPFYKGIAMLFKGWAQITTPGTNLEDALVMVEEGYHHWLASSGDHIAHSLYALIKAELYIQTAQPDKAILILEEAIDLATRRKEACYMSPMYAMLATLKPEGQDDYQLAARLANSQHARLFLQPAWLH